MKLSLRQKQTFYHELTQFVKTGIPLPQAVEALVPETSGGVRRVLQRLRKLFLQGNSVPDAFAALRPAVGSLEVSMIEASSSSGRLETAFNYLSNYFEALEALRAGVIKRTLWPIVQLHFGVFVVNFGAYFLGGLTWEGYLARCALTLGGFYLAGFVAWGVVAILLRLARTSPALDRALGMVPLLGKLRRHLALSRFCATYEMQLQAGVNVLDGTRAAAAASQSARVQATVARLLPRMRGGESFGSLVTGQGAFPTALQRAFRLGEESGSLDEDLVRWAGYYQKSAVDTLDSIGAWISRIIFIVVAGYLVYSILGAELNGVHALDQMMKE